MFECNDAFKGEINVSGKGVDLCTCVCVYVCMCDRPCGWEQGLLAQSWQPPRLELISKQMRMDVSRPGSPHWSLLTCFTFFFFFFWSLHVSIRVLLDILLFSSLQTYWSACPPPQFPSSSLPFFSFYNVLPQLSNFLGYSQNCHFIFSTSSTSTPPAILLFIYFFFWVFCSSGLL